MSARRAEEAVDAYLDRVRDCISCITDRPVLASGRRRAASHRTVVIAPENEPVRLRGYASGRVILLTVYQEFEVLPLDATRTGVGVQITQYIYQVRDVDRTEIIAFHWHPTGISRVRDPHLQLSSKLRPVPLGHAGDEAPLASMHVPIGFVPLADVVRFLIDEFGVMLLRDDWTDVLSSRRNLSDFPLA